MFEEIILILFQFFILGKVTTPTWMSWVHIDHPLILPLLPDPDPETSQS